MNNPLKTFAEVPIAEVCGGCGSVPPLKPPYARARARGRRAAHFWGSGHRSRAVDFVMGCRRGDAGQLTLVEGAGA